MSYSLKLFFPFLILLYLNPLLSQTADIVVGCAPVKVKFTAPSGFNTWYWNFNDGVSSVIKDPEHVFTSPGKYIVEFKETISGTVYGSVLITIHAKPELVINLIPIKGCTPLNTNIEDLTSYFPGLQVNERNWIYGDGEFGNGNPANHIYKISGNFDIALETKTNIHGCDQTKIFNKRVEVLANPDVKILSDPSPIKTCNLPLVINYSNNSSGVEPLTYFWAFGNGSSSFNSKPPAQTYYENGLFQTTLHVLDKYGCVNSDTLDFEVQDFNIDIIYPDSVCSGYPFTLKTNLDKAYFNWDFGPGASNQFSDLKDPSVSYSTTGWKEIKVTANSQDWKCSSSKTIKVYVFDFKESFLVSYDSKDCDLPVPVQFKYTGPLGDSGSISWSFNNKYTSTLVNPLFAGIGDQKYSVSNSRILNAYVYLNSPGCLAYKNIYVPVNILTSCFKTDTYKGCAPLNVNFLDCSPLNQGIIKWTWVFGDGESVVTNVNNPPQHIYKDCGIYNPFLIIENSNGCVDTSYSIPITVCGAKCIGDYPELISSNDTICHGEQVDFEISGSSFWTDIRITSDNGRLFHCSNEKKFSWIFNHEPGNHDVELTAISVNGDLYTKTYKDFIIVRGAWAKGSYKLINCGNQNAFMFSDSSLNATKIAWKFAGETILNTKNLNYSFPSIGNKKVLLIATDIDFGCKPDTAIFNVIIENKIPKINIPAFNCSNIIELDMTELPYLSCYDGIKWTFDNNDPPITTNEIVTKIFNNAGNIKLILETRDENGCLHKESKTITVHKLNAVIDSLPDKICLPYTFNLHQSSVSSPENIISYKWSINGLPISTLPNSVFTLTPAFKGNSVKIKLEVSTNSCKADIIKEVPIIKAPIMIYVLGDWVYCPNEIVAVEASANLGAGSFSWDFGNGDTSTAKIAQTSYAKPGVHKIKLNYFDYATSCAGNTFVDVIVKENPDASFTSSLDDEEIHCYPKNAYFIPKDSGEVGYNYNWDFGNGKSSSFRNSATVFDKGEYKTTLIVATSEGCADTSFHSYVFVGPIGEIAFDKTGICIGDELVISLSDTSDVSRWIWDLGDGNVLNDINPVSHIYDFLPNGEATTVKLVLTDANVNCTATIEKKLPLVIVKADFEVDGGNEVCVGATLQLNNTSKNAAKYFWKFSDGKTSTEQSPTITFSKLGTLEIKLVAIDTLAGCSDSITKLIEVKEFNVEKLSDITICPGDTVLIGLPVKMEAFNYQWEPSNSVLTPNNFNTLAFPNTTTEYVLSISKAGGCLVKSSSKITLLETYKGVTYYTNYVGKGSSVNLDVSIDPKAYNYLWQPTGLLNCNSCTTPVYIADSSATFYLELTDTLGCSTYEIIYEVILVPDKIIIPNVFTPNNDNRNDFFQFFIPDGKLKDINLLSFKVFNRWGQLVYNNSSPEQGWDGNFNGSPCINDVYVYVIEVSFQTGKTDKLQGEITLIR